MDGTMGRMVAWCAVVTTLGGGCGGSPPGGGSEGGGAATEVVASSGGTGGGGSEGSDPAPGGGGDTGAGSCDRACRGDDDAHIQATCVDGACELACAAGWTDWNGDPLDGCETEASTCDVATLVGDLTAPTGLAVDDAFVWFGSRGLPENGLADSYVARVPKEGGEVTVMATDQPRPYNLTVDDELLVWSLAGTMGHPDGAVMAMPKDGSSAPWVVADAIHTPGNPVISGGHVYFTARDGTIRRAAKDGSGAAATEVVVDGIVDPRDLAHDGASLFWADGGDETTVATIGRLDLPDGAPRVLAEGVSKPSYKLGVGTTHVFVGSLDQEALFRVPIDGGAVERVAEGVGAPHEIVVDDGAGRVFFTTGSRGAVYAVSSHQLPTAVEVVASCQRFTSYLAFDHETLFWTDGPLSQPGGALRSTATPWPGI